MPLPARRVPMIYRPYRRSAAGRGVREKKSSRGFFGEAFADFRDATWNPLIGDSTGAGPPPPLPFPPSCPPTLPFLHPLPPLPPVWAYSSTVKLGLHERLNRATRPTKSSPIAKISDPRRISRGTTRFATK